MLRVLKPWRKVFVKHDSMPFFQSNPNRNFSGTNFIKFSFKGWKKLFYQNCEKFETMHNGIIRRNSIARKFHIDFYLKRILVWKLYLKRHESLMTVFSIAMWQVIKYHVDWTLLPEISFVGGNIFRLRAIGLEQCTNSTILFSGNKI